MPYCLFLVHLDIPSANWFPAFRTAPFGVGAIVLSKIIRPGSHRRRRGYGFRGRRWRIWWAFGRRAPEPGIWLALHLFIGRVFGIAVLTRIFFWVPDIRGDKAQGGLREQFHFLRQSRARGSFSPPRCSAMRGRFAGSAISSHL